MGRFRDRQHSEPPAGRESCRMCGAHVPVGPDGRCRLGHPVREPGAAPSTPLPREMHADAPAVQEDLPEAAEVPVAAQTVEGPVAVRADAGAAVESVAPTADAWRSPLEDLLSWDEPIQSALDVSVEEPPAPVPAADVDAADPARAPAEASVIHDESGPADEEAGATAQPALRGLSVLLGSGALALLALAAFAVASIL